MIGKNGVQLITKIQDHAGTTKVDTEETVAEGKIHMSVGSVEAQLISDIGALTLAKQSRARAYKDTLLDQNIPDNSYTKTVLTHETYDNQNEFDVTRKIGTADATQASKLHDADGGFAASDVGAEIWNTTDDTYATVTAFVDSGELTLDADIMVNGEGYQLYHSRFTAIEAGDYICAAAIQYTAIPDASRSIADIYKNGTTHTRAQLTVGLESWQGIFLSDVISLAASDYLEIWGRQVSGGVVAITGDIAVTFLSVHKLS